MDDRDLNSLIITVELLLKEIKAIKRRQYYRRHLRKNRNEVRKKVEEGEFKISAKTGRKMKEQKPIIMSFE